MNTTHNPTMPEKALTKPLACSSPIMILKGGVPHRWHPGYWNLVPESYYPDPDYTGFKRMQQILTQTKKGD